MVRRFTNDASPITFIKKWGATGFDGDTDAIVACRALGVS
ncbi:MAG: hypothetical protein OJF52_003978 [Nitrospira sp.]|nr:MAG: hypothetical protein OJF52_003978 [Nitrospira sp.]